MELKVPTGGIILGLVSLGGFYWSSLLRKRANILESAEHITPKEAYEGGEVGKYCSISGSVQPVQADDLTETKEGKVKTVIYSSRIVQRVQVTTRSAVTIGRKTRNPRREYRDTISEREETVGSKEFYKVPFGLYDYESKKNVEILCANSLLEHAFVLQRFPMPVSNSGVTTNIYQGQTTGEVARKVIGMYREEGYLPYEPLKENVRPRKIATVFGILKESYGTTCISDEGTSYTKPFAFTFSTRDQYISQQKLTATLVQYGALFVLVASIATGAYEVLGTAKALSSSRSSDNEFDF